MKSRGLRGDLGEAGARRVDAQARAGDRAAETAALMADNRPGMVSRWQHVLLEADDHLDQRAARCVLQIGAGARDVLVQVAAGFVVLGGRRRQRCWRRHGMRRRRDAAATSCLSAATSSCRRAISFRARRGPPAPPRRPSRRRARMQNATWPVCVVEPQEAAVDAVESVALRGGADAMVELARACVSAARARRPFPGAALQAHFRAPAAAPAAPVAPQRRGDQAQSSGGRQCRIRMRCPSALATRQSKPNIGAARS